MEKKKLIEDIFRDDPFNLLGQEEVSCSKSKTQDQRLINSFEEISSFYEMHRREPESKGVSEFKLYARLKAIRNDPKKVKQLLAYDFYGLLQAQKTKSYSIEEIISDDPLGILESEKEDNAILDLKHIKKSERIRPDYIARRTICKEFEEYKGMFDCLHEDLKEGRRKLIEFDSKEVEVDNFYVLNGVILYLEKLKAKVQTNKFKSGERKRVDGNTRCIFDNGTESSMLLRSLNKALQIDGFGISERLPNLKKNNTIQEGDQQNGFIYILKSKSKLPEISAISNLYKIGYSTGDVTQRIKNAPLEPTYLMADVEVVSILRCLNLSISKLESSIHHFFDTVRLDIKVTDRQGKEHHPREWFIVPLNIIEEAIHLIIDGSIDHYKYDFSTSRIIFRE
tara:strand:- start:224 stop:1408 length:1185 start_codon:yes stop_codon:yes gene_type:complete